MNPSNPTYFLLDCIRAYLTKEKIYKTYSDVFLDPALPNFVHFHALEPLVFQTINQYDLKPTSEYARRLEDFRRSQAAMDLVLQTELLKIRQNFLEKSIRIEDFKGIRFSNFLYGESIRAGGDLDLIIDKENLAEALQIFHNLGFHLDDTKNRNGMSEVSFEELKEAHGQVELPLIKEKIHIDLHWGLYYPFLPYKMPSSFLFDNEMEEKEKIFWTLLTHHGAKEFWLRLKNLMDFGAFMIKVRDDFDWPEVWHKCELYGYQRTFKNGLYLLQKYLKIELPKSLVKVVGDITHSCESLTINYWNNGKHWGKPVYRIPYERILLKSQDQGFNQWNYFRCIFDAYAEPNPIESKRIINFPKRFRILNFMSKILSYLIEKIFRR